MHNVILSVKLIEELKYTGIILANRRSEPTHEGLFGFHQAAMVEHPPKSKKSENPKIRKSLS